MRVKMYSNYIVLLLLSLIFISCSKKGVGKEELLNYNNSMSKYIESGEAKKDIIASILKKEGTSSLDVIFMDIRSKKFKENKIENKRMLDSLNNVFLNDTDVKQSREKLKVQLSDMVINIEDTLYFMLMDEYIDWFNSNNVIPEIMQAINVYGNDANYVMQGRLKSTMSKYCLTQLDCQRIQNRLEGDSKYIDMKSRLLQATRNLMTKIYNR